MRRTPAMTGDSDFAVGLARFARQGSNGLPWQQHRTDSANSSSMYVGSSHGAAASLPPVSWEFPALAPPQRNDEPGSCVDAGGSPGLGSAAPAAMSSGLAAPGAGGDGGQELPPGSISQAVYPIACGNRLVVAEFQSALDALDALFELVDGVPVLDDFAVVQ